MFTDAEIARHIRDLVACTLRRNLRGLRTHRGGSLSELSGHASPDRFQHLLSRAKWDADGVRDDLRAYVVDHLGHPDAVLVVERPAM